MTNNQKQNHNSNKPLNAAQIIMMGHGYDSGPSVERKQSWDDLESIYNSCSEALVVANNSVVELFKIPGVIDNIENRQETKIAILGLNKDIKFFSEELKLIHKHHEGRTGFVDNEDDLSLCLQIFEKYHSFQTTYQSVIIPTVIRLSEEVGKAASNMNKQIEEDSKNGITDVAFTEVVKTPESNDVSNVVIDNEQKEI